MLHDDFDFRNPDYGKAFRQRIQFLDHIRQAPDELPALKAYYKANPADFISDFGVTFDPRNAEINRPTIMPFVLFPRQREWVEWVLGQWRARKPGLCEKSRDMGVSWLAMALSCTLCLFFDGVTIGVGSRKTEYVDESQTFKPLLPKARMFLEWLPPEFNGGWDRDRHGPFKRIIFPETGSLIAGEGGDEIGRGDRTAIYFFDEAAHHPKQALVEASLSQTTNCRIDMSSVKGMANPFAIKRHSGKISVFIFDWREDPRKDQAWYDKQCEELDAVVVAQEIDRDYLASVKGVVIPGEWVRDAIDAKTVLGIAPAGKKGIAFDVADEGQDKNAVVHVEGTELLLSEEWSGKGADIFSSTEYVFDLCDERGYSEFRYDSDGIGADVRGDARVINERRAANRAPHIRAIAYRGSEAVWEPEGIVEGTIGRDGEKGRTNQDYFANRKAQAWWAMRNRFKKTSRWVRWIRTGGKEGAPCNPDDIISLSSKNPCLMQLVAEFSQATYKTNEVGKILVIKAPPGQKSPNQADAGVIHFAPMEQAPAEITADMIEQIKRAGRTPRIGR
jgi:phage terminase large subunit